MALTTKDKGFPRNSSLKFLAGLFLFVLIIVSSCPFAFPRDDPFDNSSNWGGTGLLEIPTARVLGDGVLRFGAAQALPYRWYSMGMGIFPALEFSGRLTDLTNVPTPVEQYGSYKDKAFDIKYQVIPESKWLPAVALGLQDFLGTQLFDAQYIVFNKQVFPFDFTLGYGRERLDGPFAGIEIALHPQLHFLMEYSPIDYEKGKGAAGRALPQGAEWPVNFGLRFKPYPGIHLGLSYQRGQEIGLMLHLQARIGKQILPQKPDAPPLVPVDQRPFSERDKKEMVRNIHEAIHQAGFADVSVYTDGENLTAEFENNKYLFNQKAVGRVLRILLLYAPSDAKKLSAISKSNGIPLLEVSAKPAHLDKYFLGEISEEVFEKLVTVETAGRSTSKEEKLAFEEDPGNLISEWGVKPEFTTYLNDPSGFFKFRVGVQPWVTLDLWKGGQLHANYEVPFYSNITSSNVTVPDAVRSDSFEYLGDDFTFNILQFNQTVRFTERLFGRLTFGYEEPMYAGVGGEILRFLGDGSFAVGAEADWARKREPGTQLALEDFDVYSVLANFYYFFKPLDTTLRVQYGRFLAGDVGWLFTGSREFDTGVVIGAWWSYTDTDNMTAYNQGYHNTGVFLNLPARIFLTNDSTKRYTYAIAPWSRDVAATIYHWQTLFGWASDLMPGKFRSRLQDLKD